MTLNSKFYKQAADLNQMAVFEWNIKDDTLIYDEMMQILIQHYIPQVKVTEHLLKARLVHPEDRIEFQNYIDKILNMKTQRSAPFQDYELDFRVFVSYRYYAWMKMICRAEIEDFRAVRVVGFLKNIEKDRKERDKLKNVIERDSMTGLYSKTYAPYLVNQILAEKNKMNALLVIDLDNFKSVNDKLGHLIGDAVIMDMAMNLKSTFRKNDILGHIGGDEFMVFMRDIQSEEMVNKKCDQLRDVLRQVYHHEGEEVSVSSSIGIAISPEHGTDYKTLFTHADSALAQSKRDGKDMQTIYSEKIKIENSKQIVEESSLLSQNFRKMLANPMEYIFQMVFNSKDTSLSVQILLEIFAKYFKVHRAYVFWHIDGPYWPRILFEYVKDGYKKTEIAHDPPLRLQIRKRYKDTKNGRFSECSDTSKLYDRAQKEFERRKIFSYIECAVMDGERFIGCVGFDDCQNPRTWTKEEHDILFAFAEIMRRFLFGQIYFEMTKRNGKWAFQ